MPSGSPPLPMTAEEMSARGWSEVDLVFVTGDAYVDHPSFATALLSRVLEAEGLRIGIVAQPDWHDCEAWKRFGRPRFGFCISAGNMDSMINHYTATRKVRNFDAYSPGGAIGRRPDRATLAYSQRAREAYPGTAVIIGGVEASLRRLSHYDFWSDKVRRSLLFDSKADLLVYGMGESALREIVCLFREGVALRNPDDGRIAEPFRTIRGTAFRLGRSEDLPEETSDCIHLPSHEEVVEDKRLFAEMTKLVYENLNPFNAATLVQQLALEAALVNPPTLPLSENEMDRIYDLPFTRKPHPEYGKTEIPAYTMIRHSVTAHRGCFGGCAFCSIAAHQGKTIQSRSSKSICREVEKIIGIESKNSKNGGKSRSGAGLILSDLGGPTANMYGLGCGNAEAQKGCRRLSCLVPEVCGNLETDHDAIIRLLRKIRALEGVEQVFVASGVRTDLALLDPRYIDELVRHHVGGHLKTAPEHTDPKVLALANKPSIETYNAFCELFHEASQKVGKEQYLVPYLIAGLPGSTLRSMVEVAVYLKKHGIRPEQVQEFIPGPFELASCMYYTGVDPMTGQEVYTARGQRERRLQKALLLYHDPAYYHDVKSALKEARREELIGEGPDCLIPSYPPKKEMALRQSSRVKRLKRKQQRAREDAEKQRAEQYEEMRPVIKTARQEARKEREKPRERYDRGGERGRRGRDEQRGRQGRDGQRNDRRERRPDGEQERDNRRERDGERRRGETYGKKKPFSDDRKPRRFEDRPERGDRSASPGKGGRPKRGPGGPPGSKRSGPSRPGPKRPGPKRES